MIITEAAEQAKAYMKHINSWKEHKRERRKNKNRMKII